MPKGSIHDAGFTQMVDFLKKILNEGREKRRLERDRHQELVNLVNDSYQSLRVVGRGTVRIDPREVARSTEFQDARELARQIVNAG